MFWKDIRALPTISLNCALVKTMLVETLDDYRYKEPEDEYVEELTRNMEYFLARELNLGRKTSVYAAFVECT